MIKDLVSVIIPVYKAERFIKQTINSVINQTYKNIEIIIVDDCSPDKSADIILEMAKIYSQIKYFKLDVNSGAAVARNKGIEVSEGQYIAFLDSDDSWKPSKIEKEIELLREKNGKFAFTAIEMIDEEGKIIKSKRKIREKIDYKFLMTNTMIATSSVLIDIEKIGKFQMPLIRSGQDYATWLMLLRNGTYAYGINEALTQYRRTEGSLSSKKLENWKKVWNIQVKREGVNPFLAYIHCAGYMINALKKYLL